MMPSVRGLTWPRHGSPTAAPADDSHGFLRVLIDADNERILGAVLFGIGGDEVIHSLLDAMYADTPYTTIARAVHIHPTVSELIPTTLQALEPLD